MIDAPSTPVEPRPAASVMVFRPAASGPEVLYLQRSPDLAFHGGYWVFPGGRIDREDWADGQPHDEEAAARAKRFLERMNRAHEWRWPVIE